MSIHKTPAGRWSVRWREGDRNRQKTFTVKDDATQFDRDRQRARQLTAFAEVEPSTMTLHALLEEWWANEGPGWARSNRIPRANLIDKWIAPYIGHVRICDLGVRRISEYQTEIIRTGCTIKQANRARITLSAALGYAVRMEHLPENLCHRVKPRKSHASTPRPRAINVDQVEALRDAMPSARDKAMVSILFYGGLRPEELLALRWCDVHERTITVDRAYSAGELKSTKTGRRRSVALIPSVRDELTQLRPPSAPAGDLIAPGANGAFLDLNNWRTRVWRPAVAAAGLDQDDANGVTRLTPYCGRHSFASALIHEGRSIVEVAGHLGHSDGSTTLKHYAHMVADAREGVRIPLADAVEQARRLRADVRDLFAMNGKAPLRLVS